MNKQTQIFIFYLFLIIIPSIIVYNVSNEEKRMVYALSASFIGLIISTILWFAYGKKMVSGV